jgi:hypothetical protein
MTGTRRLTGRIQVPLPPGEAFRLFTPRGEQDWAHGWQPRFPATAPGDQVGTVTVTISPVGHHSEAEVAYQLTALTGPATRKLREFADGYPPPTSSHGKTPSPPGYITLAPAPATTAPDHPSHNRRHSTSARPPGHDLRLSTSEARHLGPAQARPGWLTSLPAPCPDRRRTPPSGKPAPGRRAGLGASVSV